MGPDQRHDRLADLGGRQIPATGTHSVQHERLDSLRVSGRDRGGQLTALRGPEQAETVSTHRVGHRQRRGHLPVERQVDPVPVRQAAPGLVIADHGELLGQPLHEAAERKQVHLRAQIGDPARITQQCRANTRRGVSDTTRGRDAVPDPRPHPSRLAPPADAVKISPCQLLAGGVPAATAQADLGRQLHWPVLFGCVAAGWDDREDEPTLPETHPVNQNRVIGVRQDDHVAYVDVSGRDHIFHK
jgi:hypothetical protein